MIKFRTLFQYSILWGVALSCTIAEKSPLSIYQGPIREMSNIESTYIENGMIQLKMKTKKVFEFQNGDQEFPEGIYMQFYKDGKPASVIKAHKAYYFKEDEKWRAQGKVDVRNKQNRQHLRTEELFWKLSNKRIFTDKFVSMRLNEELVYGTGLDAAQDLSDYVIRSPGGEFEIED